MGPTSLCCLPGQTTKASTLSPCPAVFLKLQDNVNFVSLAQQGSSSSSTLRNVNGSLKPPMLQLRQPLSPRGFSPVPGPTGWKDPFPEVRARCVCLMRDTVQFLPSPRAGPGGPTQYISLMAWFCLAFTTGIQAPGCETRKAATVGTF